MDIARIGDPHAAVRDLNSQNWHPNELVWACQSFEWRGLAQQDWHRSSCYGLQVDQCLHARVAAQHMLPRPRTRIELKPEVRCNSSCQQSPSCSSAQI